MHDSLQNLTNLIETLPKDERDIISVLVERLAGGRSKKAVWYVDDNKEYSNAGLSEVLEALNLCAAELLCLSRFSNKDITKHRRHKVYVCHPYSCNPKGNTARVKNICLSLAENNILPIAPHLFLPQFVDDETDREKALTMCCQLLAMCDEVRVYGFMVTEGMQQEIAYALMRGVPVKFVTDIKA